MEKAYFITLCDFVTLWVGDDFVGEYFSAQFAQLIMDIIA